jgi:hypothetical protein
MKLKLTANGIHSANAMGQLTVVDEKNVRTAVQVTRFLRENGNSAEKFTLHRFTSVE